MWFPQIMDKGCAIRFILIILKIHKSKKLWQYLELILLSAYAMLGDAKSLQSCPTLCDSIHSSPPGSPVPGILQARTLEWVAISFSIVWKWKVKVKSLSRVQLPATPWTAAYQAPLSMGFSRQEYWSGVPLPSPVNTATKAQNSVFSSPLSWNCNFPQKPLTLYAQLPPTV